MGTNRQRRVLRDWVKVILFVAAFCGAFFLIFFFMPLLFGHAGGRP